MTAPRPHIPPGTIAALIEALRTHPGAIPAVPVADTLKRGAAGVIVATVSREHLFRAQTPQAFHFGTLLALHRASPELATDDAAILERAGHGVALIAGHDDNIKLTYPDDLVRLERIVSPLAAAMQPRVGSGYDVHALQDGRALVLCGVTVPARAGTGGPFRRRCRHSCAMRRDLWRARRGRYRPALPAVRGGMEGRRQRAFSATCRVTDSRPPRVLANADVTLICERPKITPHAQAMIARLAELLGVEATRISVKATTTERLGLHRPHGGHRRPGGGDHPAAGMSSTAAIALGGPARSGKVPYGLLVAVFCLTWSSAFPAAKLAIATAPPLLFLGLRFSAAAILLLAAAGLRRELRGLPWLTLIVLGLLNQAFYQGMAWLGMRTVSSGLANIVTSLNPILISALAVPILGEAMTARKLAGLLLGFAGAAFVVRNRVVLVGEDPVGVGFLVIGLASITIGTLATSVCFPASHCCRRSARSRPLPACFC